MKRYFLLAKLPISKAMRNMDSENTEVKKMLEQEMVNIQNISADARKEWKGYIEKVESQFLEDTFSAAETKAAIESNLQEWEVFKPLRTVEMQVDAYGKNPWVNSRMLKRI
ncbi:hypothetical protein GIB67_037533 [Kingdonia uniflora]|uniref:Uncharacterized protein n=1 Tax=Kingdonia uniflora TaxID=39325 RepID=A0A7J7NB42_9MAGN|nr:hypothetical protein GIB67_024009 [Kingdonia uniflora]KAF6164376.1 hypothetical protein GIB67_037533 [Kingdonia uniflora]